MLTLRSASIAVYYLIDFMYQLITIVNMEVSATYSYSRGGVLSEKGGVLNNLGGVLNNPLLFCAL